MGGQRGVSRHRVWRAGGLAAAAAVLAGFWVAVPASVDASVAGDSAAIVVSGGTLTNIGVTSTPVGVQKQPGANTIELTKRLDSQAHSLRNLGIVYARQTCYDQALACLRESLAICQELGDRRGEAFSLTNTPQFGNPGAVLGNANFGYVTGTVGGGRVMQLGAHVSF